MAHCNTPQSFSKLITSATAEGALNFRRHQAEELAVSLMASTPISSPSPGLKREGVERPTTLAATQPASSPSQPILTVTRLCCWGGGRPSLQNQFGPLSELLLGCVLLLSLEGGDTCHSLTSLPRQKKSYISKRGYISINCRESFHWLIAGRGVVLLSF